MTLPKLKTRKGDQFDLILLATKRKDALEIAPHVVGLLAPEGVILPIQNGGVARVLADRLGEDKVLGGFSSLGATMVEPGVYEQKNKDLSSSIWMWHATTVVRTVSGQCAR